jgi:YVTN family beta-propeller protein
VIDGATNSVITTITVGDGPCALVYNPTNNKVYCANESSDNVAVIDGATNSVITTITVGDRPCAFTWNPVQNRTYVANYSGSSISVIRDVTGIEEDITDGIKNELLGISPNPSHSFTKIRYGLPKSCDVSLKIYNIAGQCVKTLVNATQNAGIYEIRWNGEDNSNRKLPQGIYFIRMYAGKFNATSKIVMVR